MKKYLKFRFYILIVLILPILVLCLNKYQASANIESLYKTYNMPIINIIGSIDEVTKNNKVLNKIEYFDKNNYFNSYATFKVQGATSSGFPEKNYNIHLYYDDEQKKDNNIKIKSEWGYQNKYCLKSNWVDFSQLRNIVSAKLYGEIAKKYESNNLIKRLPNGGVIDGFPVVVTLNGNFHGIYTLNIPKDAWCYGIDKKSRNLQASVFGSTWNDSIRLKDEVKDDLLSSGWKIVDSSTEDELQIIESLNNFIRFLNDSSDEDFKKDIDKYTDIERCIDTFIFAYVIYAADNTSKNIVWTTYDGITWLPNLYDMDGTWGMVWNGKFDYSPKGFLPSGSNKLYERLINNYKQEIVNRYFELRKDILSYENISNEFLYWFNSIPENIYIMDSMKWSNKPNRDVNHLEQILSFTKERLDFLDNFFINMYEAN